MELLDTENGSRHGSDGDDDDKKAENASTRLEQYVERFIAPGDTVSEETRAHLARKPVFLARSVRSYRRSTQHRLVPRPPKEGTEPAVHKPR